MEIKKKTEHISNLEDKGNNLISRNIANAKNSKEISDDKMCLKTRKNTKSAIKNIHESIITWLWWKIAENFSIQN